MNYETVRLYHIQAMAKKAGLPESLLNEHYKTSDEAKQAHKSGSYRTIERAYKAHVKALYKYRTSEDKYASYFKELLKELLDKETFFYFLSEYDRARKEK